MLSEFRDRLVCDERARRLLDAILVAARQAGFLRAGGRARTDSTHVLANVRDVNRLELVGETVRVALEVVAEVAPGWIGSRIQPGWEQRYTRRIESSRLPVGAPARTAWGAQTATDGAFLLSEIDADPDAAWIGNLPPVKGLRAIWDQQCVPDGAGRWQLREVRILEGAVHIDTPHDVEARWSTKRSTEWTGYKVHLTETCDADAPRLITQVETTAATLTDLDALNAVHADLEAKGLTPGEHYLDAGYVTSEVIARGAGQGIDIVGPVSLDTSWQAKAGRGYDRAGFTVDWDARTSTCPQGKPAHTGTTRNTLTEPGRGLASLKRTAPAAPSAPCVPVASTPDGRSCSNHESYTRSNGRIGPIKTTRDGSGATTAEPASKEPSPRVSAPSACVDAATSAWKRPVCNTSWPPAP